MNTQPLDQATADLLAAAANAASADVDDLAPALPAVLDGPHGVAYSVAAPLDAATAKLAARKMAIAARFPQIDAQIVDFCAENGLTDAEIDGALFMTKQRAIARINAQRFANRWTPPSAGKRRRK